MDDIICRGVGKVYPPLAGRMWVESVGEFEQKLQSVEDLALTVVVESSL